MHTFHFFFVQNCIMFGKQVKLAVILIGVTYVTTLCLIYKCVPNFLRNDRDVKLADTIGQNGHLAQDVYKLNWQSKEKVFFKKVKTSAKQLVKHTGTDIDEISECSQNTKRLETFTKLIDDFYIYSSYFDNRTGTPYIRMIGVAKQNLTKKIAKKTWCHFRIPETGEFIAHESSIVTFYEMCEHHDRLFGGWIVSCNVPTAIRDVPIGIRIGYGETKQESLRKSRVICGNHRDKRISRRKLKFGVCIPPVFGSLTPDAVIEFIELNKILGADMFTFYIEAFDRTATNEVIRVLKHYEAMNVATLVPWEFPVSRKSVWYHGQSLAINDCLYRNMADFEYLAFIDIDEFIIPHGDLISWRDVLESLAKTNETQFQQASGFTFKSTFYSEEFSRSVLSNEISTSVHTNRTKNFSLFRNKVMVRPSRVLELGIHHVSRAWPDDKNYHVIKVESDVAHIHHYRSCVLEFGIHCRDLIEDSTVPRKYGQFLIDNYLKTKFNMVP